MCGAPFELSFAMRTFAEAAGAAVEENVYTVISLCNKFDGYLIWLFDVMMFGCLVLVVMVV